MIGSLLYDIRHATRGLLRTPGFSLVALLTLGLGIGASTAMFTVIDSVLLRPLRFPEPQQLAMIRNSAGARFSASYVHDWRLETRTFDDIVGWYDARANLTGVGEPLEVLVDRVTANFFDVIGAPAAVGRTFSAGPDLSRVEPEVVLSYGLWQRRFGGAADVVGRTITLDDEIVSIVGVMPAGFTLRTTELAESRAELWMPIPLVAGNRTGMGGSLHVAGRLRPHVTVEEARADLALVASRIEQQYPSYSRDWRVDAVPLLEATVDDVRPTLLVLFGAVGILLLIACANTATLALTRASAQQPELAIRLSLGATGRRLVRQLLTESLVLAMAGGALGVLLAVWATDLAVGALPAGLQLPRTGEISIDIRILAFAVLVTMLTAVVFGVVPAVSSARSAARAEVLSIVRDIRRSNRTGSGLAIAEIALAVVLLVGAGLLGRSFVELTHVDPGFEPEGVLTMRTTLTASRYDTGDEIRAFGRALLERIGGLPGVSHVGFASYLPLSNFGMAERFEIEGRPNARIEDQTGSWVSVVGGRYFEAMGITLLRGRLPGPVDTEATDPVFVIDESLARQYWLGTDPIGTRLTWYEGGIRSLSGQIVGVVANVRSQAMATDPPATAYWWFPQRPGRELTVVVRTAGDPLTLAAAVSAQVQEIDPRQPAGEMRALTDFVAADLARPRVTMLLLAGFAASALLLAALGLYGVLSFGVTQRTREIGVRVALGAQGRDVLRLVVRRGTRLVGLGLAIGCGASLALGRLVAGLLYGIAPGDPATLMAVSVFMVVVAAGAMYLPARRAARIAPVVALRAP
jgi:putative ABC transport system permease protein